MTEAGLRTRKRARDPVTQTGTQALVVSGNQRDAQALEVGRESRAWPEARLIKSESDALGLVPGHVSWG